MQLPFLQNQATGATWDPGYCSHWIFLQLRYQVMSRHQDVSGITSRMSSSGYLAPLSFFPQLLASHICRSQKPLLRCLLPLLFIVVSSTYSTTWFYHTLICSAVSLVGFLCTFHLIPIFSITLKKKGLAGKDLNKIGHVKTV